MYNRFCRGEDPIPSPRAGSTQSLSLFQLLMRGFSCGPSCPQASSVPSCRKGREEGELKARSLLALPCFGAVWVVQPL